MSGVEPVIKVLDRQRYGLTRCFCCSDSEAVRLLSFGYRETTPPHSGQGNTVALCANCRDLTIELLTQLRRQEDAR